MKELSKFLHCYFARVIRKSLYLSKFFILFYGISYYFSETLTITEAAVRRKIRKWLHWNLKKKWWKISMVVATFSKDESARPPALLKTESITDILVGRVEKFQNNGFKENLWKVAAAKQKACIFRACHGICSPKHWMYQSLFPVSKISSS